MCVSPRRHACASLVVYVKPMATGRPSSEPFYRCFKLPWDHLLSYTSEFLYVFLLALVTAPSQTNGYGDLCSFYNLL